MPEEESSVQPTPKKRGRKPKDKDAVSKITGKVDKDSFTLALSDIERDSAVSREQIADILVSAMEQAYLEWSYPGLYRDKENNDVVKLLIRCKIVISDDISNFQIFDVKIVTEEDDIVDDAYQVSLEDARAINPDAKIGDQIDIPFDVTKLDKAYVRRVKQLFQAKLKEASKQAITAQYSQSIGELLEGMVTRIEETHPVRRNRDSTNDRYRGGRDESVKSYIYELSFGKSTGILRPFDQIPGDNFVKNQHVMVLLNDISDKSNPPSLSITRSSERFVLKLLENAVPEIASGIVVVKAIAREPGNKTKIFVQSNNPNIDPVGTVIGPESNRIREVTNHLNAEKIDVLKYESNKALQIMEAMKPAKVVGLAFPSDSDFFDPNVHFEEIESERGYQFPKVTAIVEKANFGAAIGKSGVNVRLASRITMCTISVMTSEEAITSNVQYMYANDIETEAQRWYQAQHAQDEPVLPGADISAESTDTLSEFEEEDQVLEDVTPINAEAKSELQSENLASHDTEGEKATQVAVESSPRANPTSTTSELKNQAQEIEHVEIKNKPKFSLEEFEQAMSRKKGPAVTQSTRKRRQDSKHYEEEEEKESSTKTIQAMPIYTEEELEAIKAQELEEYENEDDYDYDEDLEEEYGSDYYDEDANK